MRLCRGGLLDADSNGRTTPVVLRTLFMALLVLGVLGLPAPLPAPAEAKPRQEPTVPGEVLDRRTATSRTVRNDNGTLTASVFADPVHFKDDAGLWQPIDSRLVTASQEGFAYQNAANDFSLLFKESMETGFARVEGNGVSFDLSLIGAAPAGARARDSRIEYAGVFEGVDARYDVVPGGVKETLVLHHAGARSRYEFTLRPVSGGPLRAEERPDGSWAFFSASAAMPAFVLEAPFAVDAVGALGDAVMDVAPSGDEFVIGLRLEDRWLTNERRAFPVLLDPTVTLTSPTGYDDGYISAECSGCLVRTGGDRLFIGTNNAVYRSALWFDLGAISANAQIQSAQLGLYYDQHCLAPEGGATVSPCVTPAEWRFDAHQLTSAWSEASVSSDLRYDSTVLGSTTLPAAAERRWLNFNALAAVRAWHAGTAPNHGLLVKRHTEPKDLLNAGGIAVPSREYSANPANRPRLQITYVETVRLNPIETMRANGADLTWTPFVGDSGASFVAYEVYRSGPLPAVTSKIATIKDRRVTSWRDTTAAFGKQFSYWVDTVSKYNARNEVGRSNIQSATLPGDGKVKKTLTADPLTTDAVQISKAADASCSNYGANEQFQVGVAGGNVSRGLVRFDLDHIAEPGIVVDSAVLKLHAEASAGAATITAHATRADWAEGSGTGACSGDGATWHDRRGGGVRWDTDGADHDANAVGSVDVAAGAVGPHQLTVTSLAQSWLRGDIPNEGVLLRVVDESPAASNAVTYAADDRADASLRPTLTMTYTDGNKVTNPKVTLVTPGNDDKVTGKVTIAADAVDDGWIQDVKFYVGKELVHTDDDAPYEFLYDSSVAPDHYTPGGSTPKTIWAKATDDAGNTGSSSDVTVKIGNSKVPDVNVLSPANDTTIGLKGDILLKAAASDDGTVERVEFRIDGDWIATPQPDSTGSYEYSLKTLDPNRVIADGVHTLTVTGYDNHKQVTTRHVSFRVANTELTKYQAQISIDADAVPRILIDNPAVATSQEPAQPIAVTVRNTTPVGTPAWAANTIHVEAVWVAPDGTTTGFHTSDVFSSAIGPGESATADVVLRAPSLPKGVDRSLYRLRLDLVEAEPYVVGDAVTLNRFGEQGNPRNEDHAVQVDKALATKLGLERYHHYVTEDLGAGMQNLVNVANGNSIVRWTPSASPSRGLSTVVDVTYNSREEGSRSPLGNNFSLGISGLLRLNEALDIHPNKADTKAGRDNAYIEFTDGDGTTHRFEGALAADGTRYWTEPPGVHLYLRQYSTTDTNRWWAITRPDRVTYFFDKAGFPTSIADGNSNQLTFAYEDVKSNLTYPGASNRRVTTVTDPGGLSYDVKYHPDSAASHVKGRVMAILDHDDSALTFDYYDDGNLMRVNESGTAGAERRTIPDRSIVFTYADPNWQGQATPDDKLSTPETNTNQSHLLYSVTDPRYTQGTPNRHVTRFAYLTPPRDDNRGKLVKRTDRAGIVSDFSYDIASQTTTVALPESRTSSYTYDADGKVTNLTDPAGRTFALGWSTDFHVESVTEPGNDGSVKTRRYGYNANGYPTFVEDQLGHRTELRYDNVAVDSNDVDGKWRAGRGIPHISQLASKTEPNGTATATVAGDYQWTFTHDGFGNLESVTDPENHTTRYAYHPNSSGGVNGNLASVTDANNHTTTFGNYHESGQPRTITDAENNTTRMTYDVDGLLSSVQEPINADAAQQSDRAVERTYATTFDYDAFHRLYRQSQPKSYRFEPGTIIWTHTEYDANDNITDEYAPAYGTKETAQRGPLTKMKYNAMDRTTSVTGPDRANGKEETTTADYDTAGRLLQLTTPKGTATADPTPEIKDDSPLEKDYATRYVYDKLDRVTTQSQYDVKTDTTAFSHFCYDVTGDLRSTTAPNAAAAAIDCASPPSHTTRYTYDDAHRLLTQTDPEGRDTTRGYDPNGNVTETTETIEVVTAADGTKTPRRRTTTVDYDQRGLAVKVTEPFDDGHPVISRFDYDGVGNLKRAVSPRASDAKNGAEPFSDTDDYVTSYVYDKVNRLITEQLPTKGSDPRQYTHRAYDANSNLAWVALPTNHADRSQVPADVKTTMTHFDAGWIRTSDDPTTPVVRFGYRAEGWQQSRSSDGIADRVEWRHADDGQLTARVDRDDQTSTYTYDTNNNLVEADESGTTRQGVNKRQLALEYDGRDLLLKAYERESNDTPQPWTVNEFTPDLNGNVAVRVDNRKYNADKTPQAGSFGRKHEFSYDHAGWLTTHVDHGRNSDPAAKSDDLRIETQYLDTGWEKQRLVRQSDSAGALTQKQRTNWTYLDNGKLRELTIRNKADSVVEHHTVGYLDDSGDYVNGHRTTDAFTRTGPANSNVPCQTTTCTARYYYDARDRLVREHDGHDAITTFTLDVIGNIDVEKLYEPASNYPTTPKTTRTYTYKGDQLQTVQEDSDDPQRYHYDDHGNLACITVNSGSKDDCSQSTSEPLNPQLLADYAYDPFDRLERFTGYAVTTTAAKMTDEANYTYDALDRLVEENEKHKLGAPDEHVRTSTFDYIGLTAQVSAEQHYGGFTTNAAKTVSKSYSYDSAGNRVALTNTPQGGTSTDFTYGHDVHGSVSLLLNDAGGVRATYGYKPYGDLHKTLSADDDNDDDPFNPYRYTGKRFDSGSKTVDMGARRFGPDTTKFLQRDRYHDALADLGLGSDPLTQNRYSLAGGNPVSYSEVDGHYVTASDTGGGSRAEPSGDRSGHAIAAVGDSIRQITTGATREQAQSTPGGKSPAKASIQNAVIQNEIRTAYMSAVGACSVALGAQGHTCAALDHGAGGIEWPQRSNCPLGANRDAGCKGPRLPDAFAIDANINIPIPQKDGAGFWSLNFQGTVDRYGNVYFGYGEQVGPSPIKSGKLGFSAIYKNQWPVATESGLQRALSGTSTSFSVGGAPTRFGTFGMTQTSAGPFTEIGYGSPRIAVNQTTTEQVLWDDSPFDGW